MKYLFSIAMVFCLFSGSLNAQDQCSIDDAKEIVISKIEKFNDLASPRLKLSNLRFDSSTSKLKTGYIATIAVQYDLLIDGVKDNQINEFRVYSFDSVCELVNKNQFQFRQ